MKLKVEGPDLNPIETMPVLSNKQFDIPCCKGGGVGVYLLGPQNEDFKIFP